MTAEDFLKSKGIGKPTYEGVRLVDNKMGDFRIIELMEAYHQAKLNELGKNRFLFTGYDLEDCQPFKKVVDAVDAESAITHLEVNHPELKWWEVTEV